MRDEGGDDEVGSSSPPSTRLHVLQRLHMQEVPPNRFQQGELAIGVLYHIGEFGHKAVCKVHRKCSCYVMRKPGEAVDTVETGLLEWLAVGAKQTDQQHITKSDEFREARGVKVRKRKLGT